MNDEYGVSVDTSGNSVTITLPSVLSSKNRCYQIKKISSNNFVHIKSSDGSRIDTGVEAHLSICDIGLPFASFWNNGSQWHVTGRSEDLAFSTPSSTSNIIGWWKFDESSGNTAADSSGMGSSGNLVNGLTFSGCSIPGVSGNALSFDGTNDSIQLGDPAILKDNLSQITVTAWVRPYALSVSSDKSILLRWGPSVQSYGLNLFGVGGSSQRTPIFSIVAGSSSGNSAFTAQSATQVVIDKWQFLAGTYDGISLKFFLNGKMTGQTGASGSINSATVPEGILIGRYSSGSNFPKAAMDDLRIYNIALSSEEIQDLYQAGKANAP